MLEREMLQGKGVSRHVELLSKWRAPLMGIAIFWIVLYHSEMLFPGKLQYLEAWGYGGVDIFLYLAGMGVAYSLKKDGDTVGFLLRRVKRLAPAYLPFMLVFLVKRIYDSIALGNTLETLRNFLGNFFMTGWFNNLSFQFNWYIQALVWYYILSPVLFQIIQKVKEKWWRCFLLILVLSVLIVTCFNTPMCVVACRLPIFVLGMLMPELKGKKCNHILYTIVMYTAMIVGGGLLYFWSERNELSLLWSCGMTWYIFLFITPGLCHLMAKAVDLLACVKVGKAIIWVLKELGDSSFEIYLLHLPLFVRYWSGQKGNIFWLCLIPVGILAGWIYHKAIKLITKMIVQKTQS